MRVNWEIAIGLVHWWKSAAVSQIDCQNVVSTECKYEYINCDCVG